MSGLSENVPRVIALIDRPDLQWQVKRIGGAFGHDVPAVIEHLEAGLARLEPTWSQPPAWSDPPARSEPRLPLSVVYTYSQRATDVTRECWGCYKACTQCQGGNTDPGGRGRDNPMAGDLIELARDDEYDWAVVVSSDLLLIPAVRYLQSHGRKIIHGCFPPIAMDLTRECWASIDLRVLHDARGPAFSP